MKIPKKYLEKIEKMAQEEMERYQEAIMKHKNNHIQDTEENKE